jgi:predicted phosphate transport protein (TIGR00153 family)
MFRLTATNTKFYDHFDRITEILVRAASRFFEFTSNTEHVERCAAEIKRLEHEADEVTHDVLALLHRSFITPLEPGDIRRLAESLDDVLDLLDDASRRIMLYDLQGILPEVRDLARILLEATQTVQSAVGQLRHIQKKNNGIIQACIEIRRLENEGDQVNHEVLARLFKSDFDPFTVLKWKDVIVDVETAIDRCQDVSNVLEGIVLENT